MVTPLKTEILYLDQRKNQLIDDLFIYARWRRDIGGWLPTVVARAHVFRWQYCKQGWHKTVPRRGAGGGEAQNSCPSCLFPQTQPGQVQLQLGGQVALFGAHPKLVPANWDFFCTKPLKTGQLQDINKVKDLDWFPNGPTGTAL